MTDKEKITTLVNMGFSIDEAMALAAGNYRTVPDEKPEPKQDPKPDGTQEPKQDPKPDGTTEPNPDPEKTEAKPDPEPWERIEQALAKLSQAVIQSNINNRQQPQPMTAQDVLGLMLEPGKPAERSK